MIVTIDGPAGAGKSTVAKRLARRLGFAYLDTGAMYRAVALAGLLRKVAWDDAAALAAIARQVDLRLAESQVLLDGEDVTQRIRTQEVTSVTRYAAGNPEVRAYLVTLQQAIGRNQSLVTEGRDQGTIVFPNAACKFYLLASAEERARRRLTDLAARGESATFEVVLADQERRDREDASRAVGPLKAASDAVPVETDGLTIDEVVDRLEGIVRARLATADG